MPKDSSTYQIDIESDKTLHRINNFICEEDNNLNNDWLQFICDYVVNESTILTMLILLSLLLAILYLVLLLEVID